MTITAKNLEKKYNRSIIFKDLSFQLNKGDITAVLGPNGSGKSTLLKIISSQLETDSGKIEYSYAGNDHSQIFKHIGYVAPYIDIPDEFSFLELLAFHKNFKKPLLSDNEIIERSYLRDFANKPIKEYSSGMQQRVKLALNLFFMHNIYLFDEPCSHLDVKGFEWFNSHVINLTQYGTIVIASNNSEEIKHAGQTIDIQQFK